MKERKVTIKLRSGLHARPAAEIVKKTTRFQSKITIQKDDVEVDGKSVFGLMMLGATYKTNLLVTVDGSDEEEAMDTLSDLFDNILNEKE